MKLTFKTVTMGAVIFALSAGIGCKKDSTINPTNTQQASPQGPTTLQAFYNANGAATQTFSINNTTGGTIIGAHGGKYFFPANFFQTKSKVVVSGTVTVQLRELFTPVNMLLSNMPTTSNGHGLLSEGEFYVHATQASQPLIPNGSFVAHLPVIDSTPQAQDSVGVWNFNANTNTWGNSYGNFAGILGTNPDSISINSDSIEWINADNFYMGSNFYNVTVSAVNSPNIAQTAIYIYVNGHKAIWQTSFVSGTQFITPSDIPQGAPLTIVGLCTASDGTLYSVFYPYNNPGKNDNVSITFSATTLNAFTSQLAALK